MVKLNDQEWRLLMLLAEGKSAKQIGKTLGLADKTIRNHLTPIYKALGVAGSKEAITYYRRHCAEVAAKSPVWYVQCLLDAAFDSARRCWLDTPRDSRPASVRLAMCIIFHLLKDPALAMA
ncbi:MAG: response regulator transcription factor, partial [Betaproteobacteria bacterium]|nr:response regulator transcription factor [Betaproteobacteria bacterium]